MIEKGAFKDIDVCLMAHPANCDAVYGDWLALSSYTFEFFGKSAHASAAPWDGINALDAAVLSYSALGLLRLQFSTNIIDNRLCLQTGFIA
jgi:metal-dependent amidase/aminoacylase/carboxypeptidase family protein